MKSSHFTHQFGLVPGDGDGCSGSSPRFNLSLQSQIHLATSVGADGDAARSVPVGQRGGLVVVGLVVAVAVVAIVRAGLLARGGARRAGRRASASAGG